MNRIENPLSLCAGCNHYLDAKCSGKNDPGFSSCTAYKGGADNDVSKAKQEEKE